MSLQFCGSGCLISSLSNHGIKKIKEQPTIYYRRPTPPLFITRCNNINNTILSSSEFDESVSRIKEMFKKKVHISESAYDTAWVAMVPSSKENGGDSNTNGPCFPRCLEWVMENQHKDGSWGLDPHHPKLVKDSLSCTLASVLALQKWSVGEQFVQKGLDYIGKNSWAINQSDQLCPTGFDIIFPAMIHHSMEMNLNLPLEPTMVTPMLRSRDKEIERLMNGNFETLQKNMGHIVEGVVETKHWDILQLLRRIDGTSSWSVSPASNAAILMHFHDEKCFEYLSSALNEFGDYVPTIYPSSIRLRLHMVDTLQKFGVARYFKDEINQVLEETYRLWQQKHDNIFSDILCTAMAFRLLRTNGHQVSPDELAGIQNIQCPATILELYKASQLSINEKEDALHSIDAWTVSFLNKELRTPSNIISKEYSEEVEDFLRYNYHGLPGRVENRLALENYEANTVQMLKTSYRSKNFNNNKDIRKISKEDYNHCQALHREEVEQLERWYKSHNLDALTFPRHYLYTVHFLISSTLFEPEYSEARIVWTQCTVLITIIDNIIDSWNTTSKEELHHITKLAELIWDNDSTIWDNISEQVKIFFIALRRTVDDQATRASIHQGRPVRSHLISLWQEIIKNMMQEVAWGTQNAAPSMDDYLSVGYITIGIPMVVYTTMNFVGDKITIDMLESDEMHNLCWNASKIGRLLNDLQTYKKELLERQLNIINLQVSQGKGSISEEEAESSIRVMIESGRRKLLHGVLESKESLLPKLCKKLFWIACKSCYYVYSTSDEFNSPQGIKKHINEVIYDAFDPPQKNDELIELKH